MRDAYKLFFDEFDISKEKFFEFGLRETIYCPFDKAEKEWEALKYRIHNNNEVFIRGFGRNTGNTYLFKEFYKELLGNVNVSTDATNNNKPTILIRNLSGIAKKKYKNHKLIQNYQVSHVFGRTKNVYAFTAPWNIVYKPKIMDPFTGHEAKGDWINEYTKLFQKQTFRRFEKLIVDYNNIVHSQIFIDKIKHCLEDLHKTKTFDDKEITKLEKAVLEDFKPITIE